MTEIRRKSPGSKPKAAKYCVRCGAGAKENEKACAKCGMRLVSPEELERLLRLSETEKKRRTEPAREKNAAKREEAAAKRPPASGVASIFEDYEEEPKKKPAAKKTEKPAVKKAEKPAAKKAEKPAEKPAVRKNPVVKLPPKKKDAKPKPEMKTAKSGFSRELFLIPERKVKAGKAGAESARRAASRTPPRRESTAKPSARAKASEDEKRHRAKAPKKKTSVRAKKSAAAKRKDSAFADKHLRSVISMCLLVFTVIALLAWGYGTDNGRKNFAQYGLGTVRGYILLGDDCMRGGNYNRAVEYYYKALSDDVNYEAAYKLSQAYRQTGDIEHETSALLLLMDHYQSEEAPYRRILELYPDPATRPERVQHAVSMYENAR